MNRTAVVVAALGTAQTLAWASSYYLPAILAGPIAAGTGVSRNVVFGIFSGSLLLSAIFGPAVGRAINQRGGRGMLALSNVVLAIGLVLLAFSPRKSSCSPQLGRCSASAWRWVCMNRPSRR